MTEYDNNAYAPETEIDRNVFESIKIGLAAKFF